MNQVLVIFFRAKKLRIWCCSMRDRTSVRTWKVSSVNWEQSSWQHARPLSLWNRLIRDNLLIRIFDRFFRFKLGSCSLRCFQLVADTKSRWRAISSPRFWRSLCSRGLAALSILTWIFWRERSRLFFTHDILRMQQNCWNVWTRATEELFRFR